VFPTNRCVPVASVSESGEKPFQAQRVSYKPDISDKSLRAMKNIFCAHELYKLLLLASVCQKQENPPGARTLSVSDEPLRAGCVGF